MSATWCHLMEFGFLAAVASGLLSWGHLKLQSVILPLCRHLCLKPAIAVICGIIIFTAPQRGWIWCLLSVTTSVWILYFGITDSTSWKYDQNKNFHWKISSEQVSNMSATFVLTNWEKKHYNKSRCRWWFKGLVYPKMKILSSCSKSVEMSLFCWTQMKIFGGMFVTKQISPPTDCHSIFFPLTMVVNGGGGTL